MTALLFSRLLLSLFFLAAAAAAACPTGYTQINGGDCFKLYTSNFAYDAAEAVCVQSGGHLASIHSAAEWTSLAVLITKSATLIGMKCTDTTAAHCTWADGTTVDYSAFPGNPVPALGTCVMVVDNLWYSSNCATTVESFLCRVSMNNPVTACTDGYTAYNGGCAAVKTTLRTQADAESSCSLDGGHLASIHSAADNLFYQQLATKAGIKNSVYIGLANAASRYSYTDGTAYDYNNFATPIFPNTAFGLCVQMMLTEEFGTLGLWTNIPCSNLMEYACWKESGATPTKAPSQCPGVQAYYDQGSIYSPNFPVSIPTSQSCEYLLVTPPGTKASVSFPVFSTDAGSTLSIYGGLDETAAIAILSGNTINAQTAYVSTTNVMKMIFDTSAATSGSGWQANFVTTGGSTIAPQSTTSHPPTVAPSVVCPVQQYTADTYIYSPNWPSPYPPLAHCLYYIQSRDNRKMSIEFGYVDTEQCCDYIVVYDGPTNKSPQLGIVAGQLNPANPVKFYSSGTTITLEFFSDSINEGAGWVATALNL